MSNNQPIKKRRHLNTKKYLMMPVENCATLAILIELAGL